MKMSPPFHHRDGCTILTCKPHHLENMFLAIPRSIVRSGVLKLHLLEISHSNLISAVILEKLWIGALGYLKRT